MARKARQSGMTRGSRAMRVSSFSPCITAEIERCSDWMMRMDSFIRLLLEAQQGLADQLAGVGGARDSPGAVAGDPQAEREARRGLVEGAAQLRRGDAGGEQPGQRAQAEGRHRRGAARRAAGEDRRSERAIDKAARDPAPRGAGEERVAFREADG